MSLFLRHKKKKQIFSNPSFHGKLAMLREMESDIQEKITPQIENFPSEGKFAQLSLGGIIFPLRDA